MIRDPEKHTPIQRFRCAADLWRRFGESVGSRGRSAALIAYIRWHLREGPTPPRVEVRRRSSAE